LTKKITNKRPITALFSKKGGALKTKKKTKKKKKRKPEIQPQILKSDSVWGKKRRKGEGRKML